MHKSEKAVSEDRGGKAEASKSSNHDNFRATEKPPGIPDPAEAENVHLEPREVPGHAH